MSLLNLLERGKQALKKFFKSFQDKVSVSYLRMQILKNAYGRGNSPIARLDPRVLLLWYCFFGVVPWFIADITLLSLLFLFVAVTALAARITPLILILFCAGILSQTGVLFIVSLLFGGGGETIFPVLIITLKFAAVSLASLTVFSGLEPDRLALGFLWFGFPDQLVFSVSSGYRILPVLLDEFQNIMFSYRLRGNTPDCKSKAGKLRYIIYRLKIIILSFYPLMLNMAKRSRTISEALVLRGYLYSLKNAEVKRIKLSALSLRRPDYLFIMVSLCWIAVSLLLSGIVNK